MLKPASILLITHAPSESLKIHFDLTIPSTNPDVYIVESDKSIGIEQIRELQSYARKRPFSEKKYVVALRFESATLEAQNALLKLLEEPPEYLTIILTVENQYALLDTIVSRCHILTDTIEAPESEVDTSAYQQLTGTDGQHRLALMPATMKSKIEAREWVIQLLACARARYQQEPHTAHFHNAAILAECIDSLDKNANPTLSVTDTILRLQSTL